MSRLSSSAPIVSTGSRTASQPGAASDSPGRGPSEFPRCCSRVTSQRPPPGGWQNCAGRSLARPSAATASRPVSRCRRCLPTCRSPRTAPDAQPEIAVHQGGPGASVPAGAPGDAMPGDAMPGDAMPGDAGPAKCPGRWCPRILIGSCSGRCQRSVQPGVPQRTSRCPPRAALAGPQSHGRHSMSTAPGFHGWPRRHCSGKSGNAERRGCSMVVFKHTIDSYPAEE